MQSAGCYYKLQTSRLQGSGSRNQVAGSRIQGYKTPSYEATGLTEATRLQGSRIRGYIATCCKTLLRSLVAHKGPADLIVGMDSIRLVGWIVINFWVQKKWSELEFN